MTYYFPLLSYYPSNHGGPSNAIYWLHEELMRMNQSNQIFVTALKKYHDSNSEKYSTNVRFINSKMGFFTKKELEKVALSDVIHLTGFFFWPNLLIAIYALILNKRVVLSARGEIFQEALSIKKFRKRLFIFIYRGLQSKIYFHVTSVKEGEALKQIFNDRINLALIPNFIPGKKKRLSNSKEDNILFLGRISRIKNIDLILQAFSNAKKQDPKNTYKLIIAGDATTNDDKKYHCELKIMIKELDLINDVVFVGKIYGDEKDKIIATARFLVLFSKSENFGNVILEALQLETPVIVGDNAPWEIVKKFQTGYYIKTNINDLTNAFLNVFKLSNCDFDILKNNTILLSNEFLIENKIQIWVNFYNKLK